MIGVETTRTGDAPALPLAVYILYLVGFVTGVTAVVGVIIAHVNRDTAPAWVRSHYTFQIHTFWWGVLAFVVGSLLTWVLIGWLILLAWMVWTALRCVLGLSRLLERRPVDRPQGLGLGR